MKKELFGIAKNGKEIYKYTLENKNGMKAEMISYGAILVNLLVPDKNGKIDDVTLGYDKLEDYYTNGSFFGGTIAPNANRIANASFTIDGVEYKLDVNDGPNNLHSHFDLGAHKRVWDAEEKEGENAVCFHIEMADGEMGFPGNKKFSITYTLTDENELRLDYYAESDKKTVLNPTNHAYFNLAGHDGGKIEEHVLKLNASGYTPVMPGAIPTGEIASVKGTPMDFTSPKRIGDEIEADFEQLKLVEGYDHNWALDDWDGKLKQVAEVTEKTSGRTLKVFTNLPGIQFYAGNCIAETTGKGGVVYKKRHGFCLETDYFPNAVNEAAFASPVYEAGKAYTSTTIYQFVF